MAVSITGHRGFLEESWVVGALVGPSALFAPATNWIDAVALHLAVTTGVTGEDLSLFATSLFVGGIVTRLDAVGRHGRPVAGSGYGYTRGDFSEIGQGGDVDEGGGGPMHMGFNFARDVGVEDGTSEECG